MIQRLRRLRRCGVFYETLDGDPYPVRCARRHGHALPHRAAFGLEWPG